MSSTRVRRFLVTAAVTGALVSSTTYAGRVKTLTLSVDDAMLNAGPPAELATFTVSGLFKVEGLDVASGQARFTATLWEDDVSFASGRDDLIATITILVAVPGTTAVGTCLPFSGSFAAFDPEVHDDLSDPCFMVQVADTDLFDEWVGNIETNTETTFPAGVPNPASLTDNVDDPPAPLICYGDEQVADVALGQSKQLNVLVLNGSSSVQDIQLLVGFLPVDGGAPVGFEVEPKTQVVGRVGPGDPFLVPFTITRTGNEQATVCIEASFVSDPAVRDGHFLHLGDLTLEFPYLASSAVRNGSGANPLGFLEVSPPILARFWDTTVDIASQGAMLSMVSIGLGGSASGAFTRFGEALCLPPYTPPDLGMGSHSIPLPGDVFLIGRGFCAQAATVSPGRIQLLNAIDITLGTR